MKKQIINVSLVQNAKLMAALYFVISLPLVLLMAVPMFMGQGTGLPLLMLVMLPLLYTAMGFVFTLFGAWVYNLIASRLGGFEFTTVEIGRN